MDKASIDQDIIEKFLPFSSPSIDEDEINAVIDCMRSGWLATGSRVQSFEQQISDYLGGDTNAIAVTSATSGLHLALVAAGVRGGDEVITTPFTFVATANAITHAGATPVFVDIDPGTFNIDVNKIESVITARTKAIMPVHFAGLPVNLDKIYDLAKKHNLRVIEDAAHAIGSEYSGSKIGSFGDIQVFSFHPCKNMTTAEGGIITVHDKDTAQSLKALRFHGIAKDAWYRYTKEGSQQINIVSPGYKCNMSDLQASIGIVQLKKLDTMNMMRQTLANRYLDAFSNWSELTLPKDADANNQHSWHIFTVLINDKIISRDQFIESMKQYNIGTAHHYPAIHLFKYYSDTYGYKKHSFVNAESISDTIVSLPLFPKMTFKQQDYVIQSMASILKRK